MFIEKRKVGKSIKYYLVYSYREQEVVKKLRRYLGTNLSQKKLARLRQQAEKLILARIKQQETDVFFFSLSEREIQSLNKYHIKIHHLDKSQWKTFKEDFVFNTNAIEGSTVEEDEVHEILRKKKVVEPDEIETQNVAKAVEYIKKTKANLTLSLILKLHKICFKGTKSFAGSIRKAVDKIQPDVLICCHIHEAEGIEEKIGKTKVLNVGKMGHILNI